MCRLPVVWSADQMAALSLSVPQLVKMISLGVAADQGGDFLARFLEMALDEFAESVGAGGIAVVLGQERHHRLKTSGATRVVALLSR